MPILSQKAQGILKIALDQIQKAQNSSELYQVKVHYLGKNGQVTTLLKEIKNLPSEKRPLEGQQINQLKLNIEQEYKLKLENLKKFKNKNSSKNLDMTLSGWEKKLGALHPLEQMIQKACSIFHHLGYTTVSGPLIESDWYNFSALNIPKEHVARDNQDTFYINSNHLLRTHTSPVQIRTLELYKPPLAIIAPGPVFRRDQADSSHSPQFYQMEGLFVDRKVSMSDLKGTLSYFLKELQGSKARIRFRPSFFPFTEPSAEYDSSCFICHEKGCSFCKQSTWIEIGGCGLVHPEVFELSGLDSNQWQGFAFGMGIDRLALLEYGISDIRFLYENRLDFLSQFESKKL